MDGYAVRSADIAKATRAHPVRLDVIEDLPAGFVSQRVLQKGQAIRIMTGAPIPKGSDAVIPVEETAKEGNEAIIFKSMVPGDCIRKAGEDGEPGVPQAGRPG
jgi:molybdopterin molybdotransferase